MPEVSDILDRHKALQDRRSTWVHQWQDVLDCILPSRSRFCATPLDLAGTGVIVHRPMLFGSCQTSR